MHHGSAHGVWTDIDWATPTCSRRLEILRASSGEEQRPIFFSAICKKREQTHLDHNARETSEPLAPVR